MAEHVDSDWLDRQDELDYASLRPRLRTGDLMFASCDQWIARIVRRGTNSPWSHVGIVVRLDEINRVLLLESVEDMGVRFAPLSKYMYDYDRRKPYEGRVMFARHGVLDDPRARALIAHGVDELTRPYDMREAIQIVLRAWFGWTRHAENRAYICSELVDHCFQKIGYRIPWSGQGYITPAEIWLDPNVSPMARLKLDASYARARSVPAPVRNADAA